MSSYYELFPVVGIGRVAQPFGFRPHRAGHADFPHPALPKELLASCCTDRPGMSDTGCR
jgi:hypothetical protein